MDSALSQPEIRPEWLSTSGQKHTGSSPDARLAGWFADSGRSHSGGQSRIMGLEYRADGRFMTTSDAEI